MSEEEVCEKFLNGYWLGVEQEPILRNYISKLQKELKQEKEQVKIANKIIANLQELLVEDMTNENMCFIEYFYKKAEE